jgi:hypothetical protein
MTQMMPASHEAMAVREAVAAALDANWRRLDPPPKVKPKRPTTAKVKPAKPKSPTTAKRQPDSLPQGSLVLTPDEVRTLDQLLATHPSLVKK